MKASPTSNLLVVEDDAKLRLVLERTLAFEGYEVMTGSFTRFADSMEDRAL